MRFLIVAIFLLMPMSFASAASFGCQDIGKLSETETAICTHTNLSKLDETLNSAFQEKLKASPYKLRLRQEQRIWIAERNTEFEGCGGGAGCVEFLFSKYQERIKSLSNLTESQSCPTGVRNSEGPFSGDWIFEWYVDGRRWAHTISLVQKGTSLNGGWWNGVYGGEVTTGSIQGKANGLNASIEICEELEPNYSCLAPGHFAAKIDGEKLVLLRCRTVGECEKKPTAVLYHSSSKPCAGF